MEIPDDVEFIVERSELDAGAEITCLKGWEIDPEVGDWGGFYLRPFWTEHPKIQGGEPKRTPAVMRPVLEERDVQDGEGRMHHEYLVKPVREDAIYLGGLRADWRWHYVASRSAPAAKAEQATVAPAKLKTIEAEAAPAELVVPSTIRSAELQLLAAKIMEAGGPLINLNTSREKLIAYVQEHGGNST